jgi:hypothetical protein
MKRVDGGHLQKTSSCVFGFALRELRSAMVLRLASTERPRIVARGEITGSC